MKPNSQIVAGLDIGTTKVTVVIGTVTTEGGIEIVGVGNAPNTGIRQGIVVNIEATTDAIKKAREEAELMSGYKVTDVWVGVSGAHIKSFDSKGMVALPDINVHEEMADLVTASRAFEANLAVVRNARTLAMQTLAIGKR